MATRNLYNKESLAASLLYAIQTNDKKTISLCCNEFIVSNEELLLKNILYLGWMLMPPNPSISAQCYQMFLQKDITLFIKAIVDNSMPYELPKQTHYNASVPLDIPTNRLKNNLYISIPMWSTNQINRLLNTIDYCLRKKHWEHIVFLVCSLKHMPSIIKILEYYGIQKEYIDILENTVYAPMTSRIVSHAFAALCGTYVPPTRLWFSRSELDNSEDEYDAYDAVWMPIRNIPTDIVNDPSLLAKFLKERKIKNNVQNVVETERNINISITACNLWSVAPHNKQELIGLPIHIEKVNASNYWKNLLQKYNIQIVKEEFVSDTDENLDTFYVNAFPNDIPDEWSEVERQKSHPQWLFTKQENIWRPAFLLLFDY